jgi:hypothetical protein
MTSFTDEIASVVNDPVGAEDIVITTIPETSPKGDIDNLRYMVEFTFFLKNTGGETISVKVDGADKEKSPIWYPEAAYADILAGAQLVITGTDLYAGLKLTAKEKVASTPSTLSATLRVRQRR